LITLNEVECFIFIKFRKTDVLRERLGREGRGKINRKQIQTNSKHTEIKPEHLTGTYYSAVSKKGKI